MYSSFLNFGNQLIILNGDKHLGVIFLEGIFTHANAIMLNDYHKWGPIQDELDEWLKDYEAKREGMMLLFDDPEFYVLFKLRWA